MKNLEKCDLQKCLIALALLVGPKVPAGAAEAITICYEFGCHKRAAVVVASPVLADLSALFTPPSRDAATERSRIAVAIARLEQNAGRQTPTWRGRAYNPGMRIPAPIHGPASWPLPVNREPHESSLGQLDCIDKSTNSTTYLNLLQRHGWLRFHRTIGWAFRQPGMFQHWSAQIEDLATGARFAVDSWPHNNGELPDVLPIALWTRQIPQP